MSGAETSATGYDFSTSFAAEIRVERIGEEQLPVIVIDRMMRDPAALVRFAREEVAFAPVGDNLYPGVRAPIAIDYTREMARELDPLIRETWALDDVTLSRAECYFSIVTTPPEALLPYQCVPHIDTTHPLQFAVLHFLCGEAFGGTAFYRQRATGFEAVTAAREAGWGEARDAALARRAGPPGYVTADDPDYAQIAMIAARFDRLLVYRSNQLHCAYVPPRMPLMADPEHGRLTANLFIGYRASAPG